MSLNKLRDEVSLINEEKGFREKPFHIGEAASLITSEISEMIEADRINRHSDIEGFNTRYNECLKSANLNVLNTPEKLKEYSDNAFKKLFKMYIKEGVEAELVDSLIRILDTAGRMNVDLDLLFTLITTNNRLRPYRHGKNY